jgi:YidC/Oxa1 family membrane protein insertase
MRRFCRPFFTLSPAGHTYMEEKQNQLSTFVGMGLIFLLMYMWMQYTAPKKNPAPQEQTAEQAAQQPAQAPVANVPAPAPVSDTLRNAMNVAKYGAFAPAASGQEQTETLENDLLKVTFTSKGGRIKEVFLKNYLKSSTDSAQNDLKSPLLLLEDSKNRFEYELPVAGTSEGKVLSSDLYFNMTKNGNTLVFRADAGQGRYFEQAYTLSPDNYTISYAVGGNGIQSVLSQSNIRLNWINHLDKLERNQEYERTMSTVYFKPTDDSYDYCNCRANETKNLEGDQIKWFAHSNQFFNTALVANDFNFTEFVGETMQYGPADPDLKALRSSAIVPLQSGTANMLIYTGPNEFSRLKALGNDMQDIIPFGASIFGGINRWIMQPIFSVLLKLIGLPGIVILLLTLIVKLLVYPLTYKMVMSQARMSALKPQLEALKKKFGDDQQAMSVETMKLYSEFKVNPLGGCLPVLLQMPIWIALYRFFPSAIEFRQQSFLWATDLSSYDVAMKLPFMLPGLGGHISAFTIIWVVTTLWYTWYSMKQMDTTTMQSDQMKVMKYMQYAMPVIFMFFFNNFASGLTLYLCFSNILNIAQTVVTKRFLIDNDKIKAELEANRNKPKKSGGFRERLENAMKEQQRLQEEAKKKKK